LMFPSDYKLIIFLLYKFYFTDTTLKIENVMKI